MSAARLGLSKSLFNTIRPDSNLEGVFLDLGRKSKINLIKNLPTEVSLNPHKNGVSKLVAIAGNLALLGGRYTIHEVDILVLLPFIGRINQFNFSLHTNLYSEDIADLLFVDDGPTVLNEMVKGLSLVNLFEESIGATSYIEFSWNNERVRRLIKEAPTKEIEAFKLFMNNDEKPIDDDVLKIILSKENK
jgi:hypothetical protein